MYDNNTTESSAMTSLMKAYRVFGWFKLAGALVAGLAMLVMVLLIVADVVGRNWLGGSINGSFEIVQNYLMPLTVFPALAYVYGAGVLPKMELVTPRLPERLQVVVLYILLVIDVALFAVLTYYTWEFAISGMERGAGFVAGAELWPLWPLFFIVPVSMAMVLIETLFAIVKNILANNVTLAISSGSEAEAL